MHRLTFLAAAAALAGCAQGPDSIAPITMPQGAYSTMSCSQAAAERQASAERLAALEAKQRSAVAGDAVGVLLIGVPVSSLTGGDKAGIIAVEKGRVLSLDSVLAGC